MSSIAHANRILQFGYGDSFTADCTLVNAETYFHLGLAYLFVGEYAAASEAFCDQGIPVAKDNDAKVNFTNWCYATSRHAGLRDKANQAIAWVGPTSPSGHPPPIQSGAFLPGGKTEPEIVPALARSDIDSELQFTTIAFGVANWYMANGETAKAKAYLERIVQGKVWGTWVTSDPRWSWPR